MSKPLPSAVVFVEDVPRLSEFYLRVAAMTRVSGDDLHVVLELDGFQLVVHRLQPGPGARRFGIREDTHIKVCLPVASIAGARETVGALGGRIKPTEAEWEARGFRASDGHDPEGNVFQVREAA